MKIKTSNLTGAALDWAVAKSEKLNAKTVVAHNGVKYIQVERPLVGWRDFEPSTDWAQGGSILTEARISRVIDHAGLWVAYLTDGYGESVCIYSDHSELVAGLRCYVASKLGDEVDVPEELL